MGHEGRSDGRDPGGGAAGRLALRLLQHPHVVILATEGNGWRLGAAGEVARDVHPGTRRQGGRVRHPSLFSLKPTSLREDFLFHRARPVMNPPCFSSEEFLITRSHVCQHNTDSSFYAFAKYSFEGRGRFLRQFKSATHFNIIEPSKFLFTLSPLPLYSMKQLVLRSYRKELRNYRFSVSAAQQLGQTLNSPAPAQQIPRLLPRPAPPRPRAALCSGAGD